MARIEIVAIEADPIVDGTVEAGVGQRIVEDLGYHFFHLCRRIMGRGSGFRAFSGIKRSLLLILTSASGQRCVSLFKQNISNLAEK